MTMRLKDDVKALYNRSKDGKLANRKAWAKAEEGNTPLRRRAIECAEKMLVAVMKGEVAVDVDLRPEDQPANVAERLAPRRRLGVSETTKKRFFGRQKSL